MSSPSADPNNGASVPHLKRVTYFDGQRLAAEDLNDAATVQREFRWLHNSSLHNWGIGLGYAVSGKRGDRQVAVNPGYAIDCLGREIILTQNLTKAVPAKGQKTICYLVAAYPDDSSLAVLEQRAGDCGTQGAVRLQEQASIYWKIEGEQTVASGLEIVLAQATIENCQLSAPLSLDQRRSARSTQQPYVAAGQTPAGASEWELWTTGDSTSTPAPSGVNQSILLGVKIFVDTASARFSTIPEYQAQLNGPRLIDLRRLSSPTIAENTQAPVIILDGTGVLDAPDRTSFAFYVLMPRGFNPFINPLPFSPSDTTVQEFLDFVRQNWTVVWVGVEG